MTTNSWIYIALLFLFGFLNLNAYARSQRMLFICLINFGIYCLLAPILAPSLVLYTSLTYLAALLIRDEKFRSTGLYALILLILISLGIFIAGKLSTTVHLFGRIGFWVPLGFSYICLQNIGFVVDTYNKKRNDFPSLVEFYASSTFFANISSGPISDIYQIKSDLIGNRVSAADVRWALQRIVNGFFKKSVADIVSIGLIFTQDSEYITTAKLYLVPGLLLKFYFDFSGYVDIAIGGARLLGVRLPENFNRPYSCLTMADYWNRWHMTLGHWFKNYFFYPLQIFIFRRIRTRESFQMALVNLSLFVTFVLIGLWHGINFKFFIWGLFNASLVVLSNRIIRWRHHFGHRFGALLFGGLTLLFVFFGQLLLLSQNFESFMGNSYSLLADGDIRGLVVGLFIAVLLFLQHWWDGFLLDNPLMSKPSFYGVLAFQLILCVVLHRDGGAFLYAGF